MVLPLPDVVRTIHRQRTLLRMTQMELARAAGVSQSFVAQLERGRLNPSYEAVRQVVEALDARSRRQEPQAGELMQRDPLWVSPRDAVELAMRQMKEHGFSQLPVVDDGLPIGSISETDILRSLERGTDVEALKAQPVRLLMRDSFPSVGPHTKRRVLVELLRDNSAVVVVENGRLRGVVTKSDLW